MRLISGALPSTPVGCLPILSGIPPTELRRNLLTLKLACKGTNESKSLIPPPAVYANQRLKRRHFSTEAGRLLTMSPLHPGWILDSWVKQWSTSTSTLRKFIHSPSYKPPGFDLPRNAWVNLNRLRSGVAKTQSYLHIITVLATDLCECGKPQTVKHIIDECPIFKPPHGVSGLIELDDDTTSWLMSELPV